MPKDKNMTAYDPSDVKYILDQFIDYFNGMDEISHPLEALDGCSVFVSTYDHMNQEVEDFIALNFPDFYLQKKKK